MRYIKTTDTYCWDRINNAVVPLVRGMDIDKSIDDLFNPLDFGKFSITFEKSYGRLNTVVHCKDGRDFSFLQVFQGAGILQVSCGKASVSAVIFSIHQSKGYFTNLFMNRMRWVFGISRMRDVSFDLLYNDNREYGGAFVMIIGSVAVILNDFGEVSSVCTITYASDESVLLGNTLVPFDEDVRAKESMEKPYFLTSFGSCWDKVNKRLCLLGNVDAKKVGVPCLFSLNLDGCKENHNQFLKHFEHNPDGSLVNGIHNDFGLIVESGTKIHSFRRYNILDFGNTQLKVLDCDSETFNVAVKSGDNEFLIEQGGDTELDISASYMNGKELRSFMDLRRHVLQSVNGDYSSLIRPSNFDTIGQDWEFGLFQRAYVTCESLFYGYHNVLLLGEVVLVFDDDMNLDTIALRHMVFGEDFIIFVFLRDIFWSANITWWNKARLMMRV